MLIFLLVDVFVFNGFMVGFSGAFTIVAVGFSSFLADFLILTSATGISLNASFFLSFLSSVFTETCLVSLGFGVSFTATGFSDSFGFDGKILFFNLVKKDSSSTTSLLSVFDLEVYLFSFPLIIGSVENSSLFFTTNATGSSQFSVTGDSFGELTGRTTLGTTNFCATVTFSAFTYNES